MRKKTPADTLSVINPLLATHSRSCSTMKWWNCFGVPTFTRMCRVYLDIDFLNGTTDCLCKIKSRSITCEIIQWWIKTITEVFHSSSSVQPTTKTTRQCCITESRFLSCPFHQEFVCSFFPVFAPQHLCTRICNPLIATPGLLTWHSSVFLDSFSIPGHYTSRAKSLSLNSVVVLHHSRLQSEK